MKGQPTGPFLDLARLTLKSALSQPVTLLLTLLTMVGSALVPLCQLTSFGEAGKMARDGALALHLLLGTFLAAHLGAVAIRQDLENGTAASILSKPVGQATYFLSAFAGLAVMMLLFSVPAAIATLLAERTAERYEALTESYVIDTTLGVALLLLPLLACAVAAIANRFRRTPFTACAFHVLLIGSLILLAGVGFFDRTGTLSTYDLRIDERLIAASMLILMALVMMTALGLTLSTVFRAATTLAAIIALLLGGLLWDYFFNGSESAAIPMRILSSLLPNWQNFWMPDSLDAGGSIPGYYLGCALGYSIVYTAAVLSVGVVLFRNKELS